MQLVLTYQIIASKTSHIIAVLPEHKFN